MPRRMVSYDDLTSGGTEVGTSTTAGTSAATANTYSSTPGTRRSKNQQPTKEAALAYSQPSRSLYDDLDDDQRSIRQLSGLEDSIQNDASGENGGDYYDSDSEPGPPHPDHPQGAAGNRMSYAAKKRHRKKRRMAIQKQQRPAEGYAKVSSSEQPRSRPDTAVDDTGRSAILMDVSMPQTDGGPITDAQGAEVDGEDQPEDYYDDDDEGYCDDEDYDDGSYYEANASIPLSQLAASASGKPSSKGRVLTHAEVWDDSSLVNAWDAAQAEYVQFHAKRKRAMDQLNGGLETHTVPNGNGKGSQSALWYEAPTPGSKAAEEAQNISEGNKRAKELQDWRAKQRNRESRQSAPTATNGADDSQSHAGASQAHTSTSTQQKGQGAATGTKQPSYHPDGTRKIPPSIGLPGNRAWTEACATVAATRNHIGAEAVVAAKTAVADNTNATASTAANETPSIAGVSGHTTSASSQPTAAAPTPPAAAIPAANGAQSSSNDHFQSVCMSWYYAGYYTALWQAQQQ